MTNHEANDQPPIKGIEDTKLSWETFALWWVLTRRKSNREKNKWRGKFVDIGGHLDFGWTWKSPEAHTT